MTKEDLVPVSKMHLSPLVACAVRSKAVVLFLLTCCLLSLPLKESVIVLRFVVRYFMSILVLQSSWWGRESWLLCLVCLPDVLWGLCGSFSRCRGFVCSLWLWYFLIILTILGPWYKNDSGHPQKVVCSLSCPTPPPPPPTPKKNKKKIYCPFILGEIVFYS